MVRSSVADHKLPLRGVAVHGSELGPVHVLDLRKASLDIARFSSQLGPNVTTAAWNASNPSGSHVFSVFQWPASPMKEIGASEVVRPHPVSAGFSFVKIRTIKNQYLIEYCVFQFPRESNVSPASTFVNFSADDLKL